MEDDSQESQISQKISNYVPIMAFVGLGLGIIATAIGATALSKISSTAADINQRIEKSAAVELDLKKISDRVDSLAAQLEDIKSGSDSKVGELRAQTQNAVEVLNSNLNKLRDELVKDRESISKLASMRAAPRPAQSPAQASSKAPAQNSAQASSEAPAQNSAQSGNAGAVADGLKIHKIQSGDTLSKLAKKYAVSLSSILKANPDVNPGRLKIGQEIKIPQK